MLNYIWAGLILLAFAFALTSDVQDLRNHVYNNGVPLAATIEYHNAADADARDADVDLHIDSAEYAKHFNVSESVAAKYPATIVRTDKGLMVHFSKDGPLPARMAAMRDFSDSKELTATVKVSQVRGRMAPMELTFPPVRFVKMRAITDAAITTAQSAVVLAGGLIGVLALWLGLMKIAESAGLIEIMVKIIQPILHPLFPGIPKDHPALAYIAVNLAGNILGLGNATTAMGLKAMEELQKLNPSDDTATDPMVMLLAIHTAAFQLVPPATLVALLGLGAAEIFVPMLIVGLLATIVAIVAAKVLGMLPMYRRTNPERGMGVSPMQE